MSIAYPSATPRVLPTTAVHYQDMAARLGAYLLILIAACSPWGDALRFGGTGTHSDRGPTTVLAIGVIVLSVLTFKFPAALGARPRVLWFAGFVLLGMFAALVQSTTLEQSLTVGINRGGYWILMVAVMSLHLNKEKSHLIIMVFALLTTVMAFFALIDYFHIVDIPRFNEYYSSFRLDPTKSDTDVGRSLIGPFRNRSICGPYLALAWPVPLFELIHGKIKNPLRIAIWTAALALLTLAIMVNYSRALYLTIGFAGLYAIYTSNFRKSFRILLLVAPVLAVLGVVAVQKFPKEVETLVFRFTSLAPDKVIASGGFWRVDALTETVGDLMRYPQGMGFTMVMVDGHLLQTHSIFTEHIRPAGLGGLLMVIAFLWPILRLMTRRRAPAEVMVLCAALIGVLAYGVAHSTHHMVVGWIVIGALYYLSSQPDVVNGAVGAKNPPDLAVAPVRRVSRRR